MRTHSRDSSFAIPEQLHVAALSFDGDLVTVDASTEKLAADCPCCDRSSRRVHGNYTRTLADLPWAGVPARLRVRVRKFFCDEPSCERGIFAERLDEVAGVYARGTDRQREALEWIAFALGGEAGARLARALGLLVSPDTLLNRIRGCLAPDAEDVRVLGVDDFAFKRGHAYETILVDLERHKVVDLLPERSAEPLEEWLRGRPSVEVVTRDRSFVYARGIAAGAPDAGAPDAEQVADRWHLLHGLALALEDYLLRKRPTLRKAAEPEALVTDGGGVFRATQARAVYEALGIAKHEIERGSPWQNLIETHFNVQRRMADWHLARAESWPELVEAHDRFVEDYNAQAHFAHEGRDDGRRSQAEVLGFVSGVRHREEELRRAFFSTRFVRVLDALGYTRFKHWRIYGEEALAGREAALWLAAESLTVEHAGEPLSRYDVRVGAAGELRSVGRPRLFESSHRQGRPQRRLFALDTLGEGGWLKAMKLEGYAPRGPRRQQALQQTLFPHAEAL